jgi:hypothetical protein
MTWVRSEGKVHSLKAYMKWVLRPGGKDLRSPFLKAFSGINHYTKTYNKVLLTHHSG